VKHLLGPKTSDELKDRHLAELATSKGMKLATAVQVAGHKL